MGWGGDRLNVTVGDVRQLFNGTCTTMKKMATYLNKEGKYESQSKPSNPLARSDKSASGMYSARDLVLPRQNTVCPFRSGASFFCTLQYS